MLGVKGSSAKGQDEHDDRVDPDHEVSQAVEQLLIGWEQLIRPTKTFVDILK